MSRSYEVMFIVRPDLVDEEVDKLVAGFENTVKQGGGEVKSIEKMGRRKLAYLVRKFADGNYILLTIADSGAGVAELERRLRVTEPVIKFITVRTDEEDKRIAKIKAIRSTKRKLSAEVHTPAPAPVAAAPVAAAPVAAAPVAEVVAEVAPEVAHEAPAAEPVQA